MTANRRIFLNIVATYGRSLYAFACGLVTARWVLLSLGEVDFGLLGVVGSMTAFVAFLNSLMASSVGRFYAYSYGVSRKSGGKEGLEDCRRWFSIAVAIHTLVPVALMLAGYPAGEWAVRHYLTIPPERIEACVWVWRFACVSCFAGMVSVPFSAMYTAKQEIAELTIYGFCTTTLNVLFLGYMITHPGVWIVKLSAWQCFLAVTPAAIISYRAVKCYPECRFRRAYVRDRERIHQLLVYAGSRFLGAFSTMVTAQGTAILVNKCLGPSANAAASIGNTAATQANTFSGAISGSLWPAITNACGEGEFERMRRLSYGASKIAAAGVLVFSVPLALEIHEVMHLWLKKPPEGSAELCLAILAIIVIDKMSDGLWMPIFALGRIALYEIVIGGIGLFQIVSAWLMIKVGLGIVGVGVGRLLIKVPLVFIRLIFARNLAGIDMRVWTFGIFFPILAIALAGLASGCLPQLFLPPSPWRVVATTLCAECAILPGIAMVLFNREERAGVRKHVLQALARVGA